MSVQRKQCENQCSSSEQTSQELEASCFETMRPFIVDLVVNKLGKDVYINIGSEDKNIEIRIDDGDYVKFTGAGLHFSKLGRYRISLRGNIQCILLDDLLENRSIDESIGEHDYSSCEDSFDVKEFMNQDNFYYYFVDVVQWGDIQWHSMSYMFDHCAFINFSASDVPDLTQCESMDKMFVCCYSFNSPIGHWDVSHVMDMSAMFMGACAFNQPIGDWDTHNVRSMSGMFANATTFNQPIGNWNTSHVMNMSGMFANARAFNQPIGNWNTSHVTDMSSLFLNARSFNQPIGHWNTSSVTDMSGMFCCAYSFNQPIGHWNTSKVINMREMFEYALAFNQPLPLYYDDEENWDDEGEWDTSKVTDMFAMFCGAKSFNQKLEWDCENVWNISNMFLGASAMEMDCNTLYILSDFCLKENVCSEPEMAQTSLTSMYKTVSEKALVDYGDRPEGVMNWDEAFLLTMAEKKTLKNDRILGISTGFKQLDETINGFMNGSLTLIGASIGMGKLMLALNCVNHIAADNHIPVACYSYTMNISEFITSCLAIRLNRTHENVDNLIKAMVDNEDDNDEEFRNVLGELNHVPLYITNPISNDIAFLESHCRKMKETYGIKIVFLDDLQVLSCYGKSLQPTDQTCILVRLKRLARELDIPFIVLSNVSDLCTHRICKIPLMADLYVSTKCVDNVILMHRESYYDPYANKHTQIIIAKSQYKTGRVNMKLTNSFRFVEE